MNGLIVSFVAWVVRKGRGVWRRPKSKPMTRQQFTQLFQVLDDKLYSGQLHRDGISAFLADDISPAYPFIYRMETTPEGRFSGETCTEPHGYSRAVKEIVVSQNQPNDAIAKGLVLEMERAAAHLREFYEYMAPIWERGTEVFDELKQLMDRPDSEQRTNEIVKLLKRFPKLE